MYSAVHDKWLDLSAEVRPPHLGSQIPLLRLEERGNENITPGVPAHPSDAAKLKLRNTLAYLFSRHITALALARYENRISIFISIKQRRIYSCATNDETGNTEMQDASLEQLIVLF